MQAHAKVSPAGLYIHDPDEGGCAEPRFQRCSGCGCPVHLNHVIYTGDDNTPWCDECGNKG